MKLSEHPQFKPKEVLEVARALGCFWATECVCGRPRIDHNESCECREFKDKRLEKL
jgi:hypothetical protein